MRYVPPSITETAFNCPHCGALAKQFWYSLHADPMKRNKTPLRIDEEGVKKLNLDHIKDLDDRARVMNKVEQLAKGRVFMDPNQKNRAFDLYNINISSCYNCDDLALWVNDRLIWPQRGEAPMPNPDLPDDVREDYEEASSILDLSHRGAAALLRLAIQRLCKHLGGKGKHLDTDIAALVTKGLSIRVQQALDVVRVVGNNALHPGQLDLRDDRKTAETLFRLVNLIAEKMISEPKHIEEVYSKLPPGALKAIKKRDGS